MKKTGLLLLLGLSGCTYSAGQEKRSLLQIIEKKQILYKDAGSPVPVLIKNETDNTLNLNAVNEQLGSILPRSEKCVKINETRYLQRIYFDYNGRRHASLSFDPRSYSKSWSLTIGKNPKERLILTPSENACNYFFLD